MLGFFYFQCIVSVGPFPFPGLDELRHKHRGLVGQETPYKSFFLAKRELDNLKKHYSAIKHRQKATTIILKGLNEASRIRVPGQRSNSLFIPTTKKQVVSPKPRMRRGSSGSKSSLMANNNNNNNHNLNNSNVNILRNNVSNNGNPKGKQVRTSDNLRFFIAVYIRSSLVVTFVPEMLYGWLLSQKY